MYGTDTYLLLGYRYTSFWSVIDKDWSNPGLESGDWSGSGVISSVGTKVVTVSTQKTQQRVQTVVHVADPERRVHFRPDPDPKNQNFENRIRIRLTLTKNQIKKPNLFNIYHISLDILCKSFLPEKIENKHENV